MPSTCEDYFFSEDDGILFQVTQGGALEVPGSAFELGDVPKDHVSVYADACPPDLLLRNDSRAAPELLRYLWPSADAVRTLFSAGRSIYWMDGHGGSCRGFRVVPLLRRRNASSDAPSHSGSATLETFVSQEVPPDTHWGQLVPLDSKSDSPEVPFFLVTRADEPPMLMLGTGQRDGKPAMKCRCERLLRVMNLQSDEFHLLGRRFPSDPPITWDGRRLLPPDTPQIAAYDVTQVERWFVTLASCERERLRALDLIREDRRRATKVGFHADFADVD